MTLLDSGVNNFSLDNVAGTLEKIDLTRKKMMDVDFMFADISNILSGYLSTKYSEK